MFKQFMAAGLVGVALVLAGLATAAAADPATGSVGKKVGGFTLTGPRAPRRVALADLKDHKAVLGVFLGTECPINNAFLTTLMELHKEYGSKGVAFLGINSNVQDTPERVAAHARKNGVPFLVLKDADNKVADQ